VNISCETSCARKSVTRVWWKIFMLKILFELIFHHVGRFLAVSLKKFATWEFLHDFALPKARYTIHAWQLLCFLRWGWGDGDNSDVGDKTGENHSLSHSRTRRILKSWGILSVSASFLSGYFDQSPRHWRALPAQSADERSWCTACQKTIRQSSKGCSSYTHLSQLFWCTWPQLYKLTGALHILDLMRYTSQTQCVSSPLIVCCAYSVSKV